MEINNIKSSDYINPNDFIVSNAKNYIKNNQVSNEISDLLGDKKALDSNKNLANDLLVALKNKKDLFTNPNDEIITKNEIFKKYTIQDLESIKNNEIAKKEFYNLYNSILYNNFYDIYDILKEGDNDFKYSINDDKISNLSYQNDSISFYANIKALDRIIEKMKRKNKSNLSEITDIVRGRVDCRDINQALEIYNKIKNSLNLKNKELIEEDNMIINPRPDYMGRIHLLIKDKETGGIFELQIGSKNITNFIEKSVVIDYGTKENLNNSGTITYIQDTFKSNFHDLCYKALDKILDPNSLYYKKYNSIIPKLQELKKEYVEIQKEIFESEKNSSFEQRRNEINKKINNYVLKVQDTFRYIDKNDIESILS
jgi:hypothetical protein